jgi:methionyl-tRNA formyltransferase
MSSPLKIVFAGTPDFAAQSLKAVLENGEHQVLAVLTQPDRPAGRGKKLTPSPVKVLALEHQLPVWQPENLKGEQIAADIAALNPDVMVVVAYGLIIPQHILDIPRYGCINVHGSLLPRWRGAAPIQRAIAAGDQESGVGIMQMEAGLDTGPVLLEKRCDILPTDTGGDLHDRLADLGASALVSALADLPSLAAKATAQPQQGITYAHKLSKEEAQLQFDQPAIELANRIRAFNPWPVCWCDWQGNRLRIWQATATDRQSEHSPGTVLAVTDDAIEVACAEGSLCIFELQMPGKKAMAVAEVLRGHAELFKVGDQLG